MKVKSSFLKNFIIGLTFLFIFIEVIIINFKPSKIIANPEASLESIEEMPSVSTMKKIMIFAPHPDDETLACAGLISEARKNNIPVIVVVVSNGENSYTARLLSTSITSPSYYIKFGEKRQNETLMAMKILSVPKEEVIFLGYPDSGLRLLWENYWNCDKPYTHNLFHTRFSPFQNIFKKNAPYCGISVLEDIKTIIKKYNPSDIFIPSNRDNHPTHWAVNSFTMMALEELKSSGFSPRVYTYIVHKGKFPYPYKLNLNGFITPPLSLLNIGISWRKLSLENDAIEKKYEAIKQYKSQLLGETKDFMLAFARKNELFAKEEVFKVPLIKNNLIKLDGKTNDWENIPPFFVDSLNDNMIHKIEASGDIVNIFLAQDEKNLYIMLKCNGQVKNDINYYLYIFGANKDNRLKIIKEIKPQNTTEALETSIPLSSFNSNSILFIGAKTKYKRITIDKTPYHLAILTQ